MINIFIAIAPLQLLAISSIIKQMPPDSHIVNICFVFYKSDIAFEVPNCTVFKYNTHGLRAYFAAMTQFRKEIKQILNRKKKLAIYIPHPYHLPTNYLLFGIKKKEAYLIPDGILNYYESKITIKPLLTMLVKCVLARILGITYTPYTGHLTAFDKRVYSGVYTFNPDGLLTACGQIHIIRTDKEQFRNDKKICLFLDQDIESLLNKKDSENMRAALSQYLASGEFDEILYKPHPSVKQAPLSFGEGQGWGQITPIHSTLPAEMLISQYCPTEVISYVSSALINIRDIYPDVACTSVGLNKLLAVNLRIKPLYELFVRKNIRIIEV
jgi:hypothetical protein